MGDQKGLLQQILENVNSWLHFAEAKNAALIAFNISLLTVIMDTDWSEICSLLFAVIVIGLLGSTMFAICSFKPINTKLGKSNKAGVEENLLHFAYIASLESDEYIKKLYDYYWGESNKDINSIPQLEKDYCQEIVENSRIAVRKQKYFAYAFYMVLAVIVTIGMLVICA